MTNSKNCYKPLHDFYFLLSSKRKPNQRTSLLLLLTVKSNTALLCHIILQHWKDQTIRRSKLSKKRSNWRTILSAWPLFRPLRCSFSITLSNLTITNCNHDEMETLVVVVVVEQKPKFDQHKKMPFLPKKQFHTIVNQLRTQYSTTNSLIDAHDATKTTKIQSKHNQTKAPPMQTQKPALLCANIREICCNYIHTLHRSREPLLSNNISRLSHHLLRFELHANFFFRILIETIVSFVRIEIHNRNQLLRLSDSALH